MNTTRERKARRSRSGIPGRSKRHSRDELYLAVSFGLLILMVTAMGLVATLAPPPDHEPQFIAQWLKCRESQVYFLQAKSLIKPMVQPPVERWSCLYKDTDCLCTEAGNGIWYANGIVVTSADKARASLRQRWEILFRPGATTPLFASLGEVTTGDRDQALSLAGLKDLPPQALWSQ